MWKASTIATFLWVEIEFCLSRGVGRLFPVLIVNTVIVNSFGGPLSDINGYPKSFVLYGVVLYV